MALQDDIFDVRDALEGKPEAEQFDRILSRFYAYERDCTTMGDSLDTLRAAAVLLRKMGEGAA